MPYHLATAQRNRPEGPGLTIRKDRAAPGCAVFGGVPRGIRTLGLQSHNLAR